MVAAFVTFIAPAFLGLLPIDRGVSSTVAGVLMTVVACIWAYFIPVRFVGQKVTGRVVLTCLVLGVVAWGLGTGLFNLMRDEAMAVVQSRASNNTDFAALALGSVVLLSPISEEVFFRLVIQNLAESFATPAAAAFLSLGVFAVVHLSGVNVVSVLPLALLNALVYMRYRVIWLPIATHIIFNALSVVVPVILARF